jgi:hypothetical protein
MGAYFHSKQIKIKESEINLAVWDTAGEGLPFCMVVNFSGVECLLRKV